MPTRTRSQLDEENAGLKSQVARLEKERDTRDARICEVAKKYTEEHGWCEEVQKALVEAGIKVPEETRRIQVSMDFTVEVTGPPVIFLGGSEDICDRDFWIPDVAAMQGAIDQTLSLLSSPDETAIEFEVTGVNVDEAYFV